MAYFTLMLTSAEIEVLSEAVRRAQQTHEEGTDQLNPTLSRIQRKLGETPGSD